MTKKRIRKRKTTDMQGKFIPALSLVLTVPFALSRQRPPPPPRPSPTPSTFQPTASNHLKSAPDVRMPVLFIHSPHGARAEVISRSAWPAWRSRTHARSPRRWPPKHLVAVRSPPPPCPLTTFSASSPSTRIALSTLIPWSAYLPGSLSPVNICIIVQIE